MSKREMVGMTNSRQIVSTGLAAATLAIVLTYALGAQAILQSPYAEPSHNLYMSMFTPLIQATTGGHESMARMHGGPASEPAMQEMPESEMRGTMGILANNMLGDPQGMAAAGLGAVVLQGAAVLTVASFVVSWKQKSLIVGGSLAASGAILVALPLANMNFAVPGPIIGVVVGLGILGLGMVKGIRTAMVTKVDLK